MSKQEYKKIYNELEIEYPVERYVYIATSFGVDIVNRETNVIEDILEVDYPFDFINVVRELV